MRSIPKNKNTRIILDLPTDLDNELTIVAAKADVSVKDYILEAIRNSVKGLSFRPVSKEIPDEPEVVWKPRPPRPTPPLPEVVPYPEGTMAKIKASLPSDIAKYVHPYVDTTPKKLVKVDGKWVMQ